MFGESCQSFGQRYSKLKRKPQFSELFFLLKKFILKVEIVYKAQVLIVNKALYILL